LVDQTGRDLLVGKPAAIQFMNGTVVSGTEVVDFVKDPRSGAIRFFQYRDGARKPRMKTSDIYRLVIGGKAFSFRYHRPSGGLYLIDAAKAQQDAQSRIADKDKTLREPQTEQEVKDGVANQIGIFNDAREKLAPTQLNLVESGHSFARYRSNRIQPVL
jgi:hypothetical protein